MTPSNARLDKAAVVDALQGRFLDFYQTDTPLKQNGGEWRGPCPLHGGDGPNFAVDPDTGQWYCHSQCQDGGDVFDFVQKRDGLDFPQALERVAAWAGVIAAATSVPPRRNAPLAVPPPFLDSALAESAHSRLMAKDNVRGWLSEYRGLTTETLKRFQIGLQNAEGGVWRVTFPVYDAEGYLTNIRRHLFQYTPDLDRTYKTLPFSQGLQADLFPRAALDDAEDVLVVEGEADAALACQLGFAAVTGTLGAGNWKPHWTEALRGKRSVTILYDNDHAGQEGAQKVAAALSGAVQDVRLVCIPDGKGKDLTEWIVQHGATAADVQAVIDKAQPFTLPQQSPPTETTPALPAWPQADPAAFYGLAGDIVRVIEPHSEADPVALLVQILAAFGSSIGRSAHFKAEKDKHYGNLFAVLVGVSSKARKGTSWGQVRSVFLAADPVWTEQRIHSGASSGEGMIYHVRDPIEKQVKNKKTGEMETVVEDPGIEDKRLLVMEAEFASVLRVAGRDGNTLSAILRNAWDTGDLQTMTKNSPTRATGAHISLIGHVTADELRRELSSTEAGNGFANRFLWVCAKRSKELPEGGNLQDSDLAPYVQRLHSAIQNARGSGLLQRDDAARAAWVAVYHDLSEGGPGLSGAVTSRAEAQVMRLALLYALLDQSGTIRREHLTAALALWEYVEASARFIFGDSLGDSVADDLLRALRSAKDGMARTDMTHLFGGHQKSARIGQALALLQRHNRARMETRATAGRSAEHWFAVSPGAN